MRKFVIITLLLAASVILSGGDRHPSIGKSDYTGEPFLPVIIVVERPGLRDALAPYSEMRGSAKRRMAISTIKEYSAAAQGPIISELNRLAGKGKAASIEAHWLGGCIAFHGTPAAIRQIATRQDVVTVIDNVETKLIEAASNPWNEAGSPSFHKTMLTTWAIRQVKADSVWVLGYEGEGVIICLLDSGVRYTHSDLQNGMWHNPNEIPANGVDDDLNGFVDDYYGYDFYNSDSDPADDNGHGTACAGLVVGDGTSGSETGIAPCAKLMAIKLLSASGSGYPQALLWGLEYGMDMEADVFSMSLGWSNPGDSLKDWLRPIFEDVLAAGMLVSSSAGNGTGTGSHYPVPQDISSPADCPSPSQTGAATNTAIISVSATNIFKLWASFSSYGPTHWDTYAYSDFPWPPGLIKPEISAPGQNVPTTSITGDYDYTTFSGTSAAAPIVAGGIALALSKNPLLVPREIDSLLRNSAWDRGPVGHDTLYGAGILDCAELIRVIPTPDYPILQIVSTEIDDSPPTGDGSGVFDAGETVKLIVDVYNSGLTAPSVTGTAVIIGDPYITAPDPNAGWGTIATGVTEDNSSNPFLISSSASTPPAHSCNIEISVSSLGYTYVETVSVSLGVYPHDYADHQTPTIQTSITNFGAFGYFNPTVMFPTGFGFAYNDTNTLWGGGFFLGIAYDSVITAEWGGESEFKPLMPIQTATNPDYTENNTSYGDPATGLVIHQRSLSYTNSPYEDFIMLITTTENRSAVTHSNLYLGFYLDFDIHNEWVRSVYVWRDRARFILSNEWGYMWDEGSPPRFDGYVGLVGLNGISRGSVVENDYYVYPEPDGMGWADSVKYNFMSGAFSDNEGSPAEDWSLIICEGPFTLTPGAIYEWAVAAVGGDDLSDWQFNALAARDAYTALGVREHHKPKCPDITVCPNPFNSACRITISGSRFTDNELRTIKIFDICGKSVFSRRITENEAQVIWDGRDSDGNSLPSGIYFVRESSYGKTVKLLLLR